jgi:hypothetical protein
MNFNNQLDQQQNSSQQSSEQSELQSNLSLNKLKTITNTEYLEYFNLKTYLIDACACALKSTQKPIHFFAQ